MVHPKQTDQAMMDIESKNRIHPKDIISINGKQVSSLEIQDMLQKYM